MGQIWAILPFLSEARCGERSESHLENFIFACNAVLPTFVVILLGICLKRAGILTELFIRQGNTLCFQVLFPVLVFINLYDAEQIDGTYLKSILFALAIIAVSLMVLLGIVPKVVKDNRRISVLIQSAYRGNFMLYGLPFSKTLGGSVSVAQAASIMAVTLPVLNVAGVFIYSYFAKETQKPDLKKTLACAVRNPIIFGVILGITFRILCIPLPDFLYTAGTDVSKIATSLAFLLLGGNFQLHSAVKNRKALAVGLLIKLLLLPAIALVIAIAFLDITGSSLVPIFIFAAAPTAITNYQMALQYDADAELAGDFLIYSMLFSVATMFLFIYILRTGGWI